MEEDDPRLPEGPFSGEGDLESDNLDAAGNSLRGAGEDDEEVEDAGEGRRACWYDE